MTARHHRLGHFLIPVVRCFREPMFLLLPSLQTQGIRHAKEASVGKRMGCGQHIPERQANQAIFLVSPEIYPSPQNNT